MYYRQYFFGVLWSFGGAENFKKEGSMSQGSNPNLDAIVGTTQQKVLTVPYSKNMSRVSPETRSQVSAGHRESTTAAPGMGDTASISRAGIVALETAPEISGETVIRDEPSPDKVFDYAKEQIARQSELAIRTQANQTASDVLALYRG
jgi:hypothetical protein